MDISPPIIAGPSISLRNESASNRFERCQLIHFFSVLNMEFRLLDKRGRLVDCPQVGRVTFGRSLYGRLGRWESRATGRRVWQRRRWGLWHDTTLKRSSKRKARPYDPPYDLEHHSDRNATTWGWRHDVTTSLALTTSPTTRGFEGTELMRELRVNLCLPPSLPCGKGMKRNEQVDVS